MRPSVLPFRTIALALACLAVSLRLVVPAGMMPSVDSLGRAALVICTAQGPRLATHQDGHAQDVQKRCPFEAYAAAIPVETAAPRQSNAVEYPAAPAVRANVVAPGQGLTAPPPPPRGPPFQHA